MLETGSALQSLCFSYLPAVADLNVTGRMKCPKIEDYVQQIVSIEQTIVLYNELKNHLNKGHGLWSRTVCDRVIRACLQLLGGGTQQPDHQERLVDLVELAAQGYDAFAESGVQGSSLYLEKIIFHILQKLVSQGAHAPASRLGLFMYNRLQRTFTEAEGFTVLLRNCFAVLWNSLLTSGSNGSQASGIPPKQRLHWQLQALLFRLLEVTPSAPPSACKVPLFLEEVLSEYERMRGSLTPEDAVFLLTEIQEVFLTPVLCEHVRGDQALAQTLLSIACEVVFKMCKTLCKNKLWAESKKLVDAMLERVQPFGGVWCSILDLVSRAVQLHCALCSGTECTKTFTDCTRILRGLPANLTENESHAVICACMLVSWMTESGQIKEMSGPVLLTSFSFLEEYQELLIKQQNKSFSQMLQHSLCFSMYHGFISTYDSLRASQDSVIKVLDRVLLYCKATAGRMMTELRKLSNDNFFLKAVYAVSNVVYELFNRKFYAEAFDLIEIICQELSKDCPPSLPVDKRNRCFMLVVQCSRRAAQFDKALDWVARWIQALGPQILAHLTEPVSLWVKTKCDATRAGDEDTRLRTLRDVLGAVVVDDLVLLHLLEEELRVYKEQTGDTSQERYNTLCDLLDICHEDTPHKLRRAFYLCEMAQVVCYRDFSEQTDCSAVDFAIEAQRLLEEETETEENADRLKDEKAHASLWIYICTLEANLQEALDTEKRLRAVQEGTDAAVTLDSVPTNDLEFEDKQKLQESQLVYDGLRINLSEHNKHNEPLDKCLALWVALLKKESVPAVRDPKHTASSILLMASLYSLMGKPLHALESYQLAAALFQLLGDGQNSSSALLHAAKLLLDLGSPHLAQVQLDQAQKCLVMESSSESITIIAYTSKLLSAQLCLALGQMENGISSLCEVLKKTAQHHSKSWYMLKARALQLASTYLSLDTGILHTDLRQTIIQHGFKTPDTTQYEALKLLCSLVMMLLGNGFYGAPNSNMDTRFVDQGDSVMFKWQLLSEVLLCSKKMVQLRSSGGTAHEAKSQCLEALRLATKLHTLSHCAELLVMKAELEMMKGANDASALDLEQVRHLLELCTDFGRHPQEKSERKIKPRKGRAAVKNSAPEQPEEEDIRGILSTCLLGREALEELCELGQGASPPMKLKRQRMLSCLSHAESCPCPCCSEPYLARVSIRWALAQAEVQTEMPNCERLRHLAKLRCYSAYTKLNSHLAALVPTKHNNSTCLLQPELGRVHLSTVRSQLYCRAGENKKAAPLWEEIEAGLLAVEPKGALFPELGSLKAALLMAKAVACCLALAGKKQCSPDELCSTLWGWKPSSALKNKTQFKSRTEQQNRTKTSRSEKTLPATGLSATHNLETKKEKAEDPLVASARKTKNPVPKISITNPGIAFKTPRSTRTPRAKPIYLMTPAGTAKDLSAFDFTNEVPEITVNFTPLPSDKGRSASRCASLKLNEAAKGSFQVFEDSSPQQNKTVAVPAAPKRTKRSRFKVEFSDDSDAETNAPPTTVDNKSDGKKTVPSTSKTSSKTKGVSKMSVASSLVQDKPSRKGAVKKSTVLCSAGLSSDDDVGLAKTGQRRGRSRKAPNTADVDKPEKMRMIREDEQENCLNVSLDELHESDSETFNTDCEVLRRDLGADLGKVRTKVQNTGQINVGAPGPIPHPHVAPGDLSVEAILALLKSSWLLLHHFPNPSLYPHLCSMLVQLLGPADPITTAMLHAQSLGVTTRHHMTRHLANRLRKLKKSSCDVTESLNSLSLEESSIQSQAKMSALESIYSFTSTQPTQFPQFHCQEFMQQLQDLPAGVTVCMLSLVGVCPGEIGNTVLLTRLEHDSPPTTIRIQTAHRQRSMTVLLEEMDGILQGQKKVSGVADKAQWWEGRKSLDARVQKLLEEMEDVLGVWRALLLPLTSDPQLLVQQKKLQSSITGTKISLSILKVVLSAAPFLSSSDLQSLAEESGLMDGDFLKLLQKAASELKGRKEPQGHTVLILDKYLQKLPWENISCLKPCSVTRMPSLHAVQGHSRLKQMDPESVLSRGVDPQQVYFVLNPDRNLPETEKRFKDWFTGEAAWQGVCGSSPDPDKLQEAITTKDLYIYVGHGAGARFLDSQSVLRGNMRAVALLFGCSSGALSVQGGLEGTGIILSYLIAGCPLVLGNLWDVTDRDIDRFTSALLQSWLSAGSGSSLLQHLVQSRDATHLKNMIGAAPIAYGMPVYLR